MSFTSLLECHLPAELAEVVLSYSTFPFHSPSNVDFHGIIGKFLGKLGALYRARVKKELAVAMYDYFLTCRRFQKNFTEVKKASLLNVALFKLVQLDSSKELKGSEYFFYDRLSIDGSNPIKHPGADASFDFGFAEKLDKINATIKHRDEAFRQCLLAYIYKYRYNKMVWDIIVESFFAPLSSYLPCPDDWDIRLDSESFPQPELEGDRFFARSRTGKSLVFDAEFNFGEDTYIDPNLWERGAFLLMHAPPDYVDE